MSTGEMPRKASGGASPEIEPGRAGTHGGGAPGDVPRPARARLRGEALREAYEERAAILEYDAADVFPSRAAAEAEARRLTGYRGW